MLSDRLRARGHTVHTFAATLAPGRPMYSTFEDAHVTRIVNNVPGRETRHDGADPTIDRAFQRVRDEFKPDLVHIQHLAGLSSSLPLGEIPTVWTLHDGWAWCASGGLELRADVPQSPCEGPGARCAACTSAWLHDSAGVDRALSGAQKLAAWIPADRLHRLWKALPLRVRGRVVGQPGKPVTTEQIDGRTKAFQRLAARCTMIAPSRFLAERAEHQGLGRVQVIPHGIEVAGSLPAREQNAPKDAPFVFLGTLARHKGPDRVRAAWELAGKPAPLKMYGPAGNDPAFAVENDGPLPHAEVAQTLAAARALVLGSIWPENAPLVILEARAAGCPVIAPAIGGIPELVEDGVDGYLYPPGDITALAERLLRPLPQTTRPPPTLDAHVTAMEQVYAETVNRRARQKRSQLP